MNNEELRKVAKLLYRLNAYHSQAIHEKDWELDNKVREANGWAASFIFWQLDPDNNIPFPSFWGDIFDLFIDITGSREGAEKIFEYIEKSEG